MLKRIVYPLIILMVTLGLVMPGLAATYPFNDVDRKHPAYQEIYVLNKNNILSGVTYERFGGELDFKRFDLADSLVTLLGNRQVPSNVYTIIADVQPGSEKYKIVSKVIQANLIELQDNKFQGLRPVTRYELMQSLQRLLNFMGASPPLPRDKELKFRDVDPEYKEDVQQVTNVWQITEGYPDGLFRGDNRVTRYEAAIMLSKVAAILYEDFKIQMQEPAPLPRLNIDASNPNSTPTAGNPVVNTQPTAKPTLEDLLNNSTAPTAAPRTPPSSVPTAKPSGAPSAKPTVKPTVKPTTKPTVKPSAKPTAAPTTTPSAKPTASPVVKPTSSPQSDNSSLSELEKLLQSKSTPKPTPSTAASASAKPNIDVSKVNISDIFGAPKASATPSAAPTAKPSAKPTTKPSAKPTVKPSAKPTAKPSVKPTAKPSAKPTAKPSVKPSAKPTAAPTAKPSAKPSAASNIVPSSTPTPSDLSALEKRLLDLRSSPTPKPTEKPILSVKPAEPETLTKTPLPTPTPRVASATPTPAPPELPKINLDNKMRPALDSRILLYGNYRALYEERVPPSILQALSMDPNAQSISGDAGMSANLNTLIWFGEPQTPLGNLGVGLDIASLGGIKFSGSDLTDLIWADLSILYKVVNTPHFDLAAGLSGYYRMTDSSNDPRTNYFQASRNYIGAGARFTGAYRIIDPLSLELSVAPHYVIQDLSNIDLPNQLPLNRFDTQVQFMLNWDMFKFGNSTLSLNVGYQGLILLDLGSEASQMMHGVIFGTGYHF